MSDLEVIRRSPFNAETPGHALRLPETPSRHAYVRSNFDMPELDDSHVISLGGLVDTPLELTARELRSMPQCTIGATMECAGNDRMSMAPLPCGEPWQHGALSTLSWTGVPLRELVARAGLQREAAHLVFRGADSGTRGEVGGTIQFERSLPTAEAMQPDVLLALSMNGQPLTREHGAPVRLVVPGWYGMTNVKWLMRIDAREMPSDGFFQRSRYVYEEEGDVVPVTRMRVKSIITSPVENELCAPRVTVEGWAWSGFGSITRVELAIDGGDTWTDAQLGSQPSPYTWAPWRCTVSLTPGARVALRSRATDSAGNRQPDTIVWNRLGYGNNAVRTVTVMVSDAELTASRNGNGSARA
jgi:DMSO/TMAO reductase YedYZ molybdopterin-dependent catalytic subunit